jgi:hypothetical protein
MGLPSFAIARQPWLLVVFRYKNILLTEKTTQCDKGHNNFQYATYLNLLRCYSVGGAGEYAREKPLQYAIKWLLADATVCFGLEARPSGIGR